MLGLASPLAIAFACSSGDAPPPLGGGDDDAAGGIGRIGESLEGVDDEVEQYLLKLNPVPLDDR